MPPGLTRAVRVDALFEVQALPVQHAEPVASPEARPYSLFAGDRCKGAARRSPRCGPPDAYPAHVLVDGPRHENLKGRQRSTCPITGVEPQLRGDASWARLTTAAGDELIDALEVDVHQLRIGIDVSRPMRTAGGTLFEPFGEVHARRDGGSGQTGAGLEVAGGLRVARSLFRVEGMGRLLALHAADGYRKHATVTVSVGDGARQPGLTLSLSPRWGAPATASDALWQDHLSHQRRVGAPGARRDDRALDTRVDYGLQLPAGGLLTPFGIYGHSQYGRRLQVGLLLSRLGTVGPEASGERYALLHPGRDEYRMTALRSISFGGADNAPASMSARLPLPTPRLYGSVV